MVTGEATRTHFFTQGPRKLRWWRVVLLSACGGARRLGRVALEGLTAWRRSAVPSVRTRHGATCCYARAADLCELIGLPGDRADANVAENGRDAGRASRCGTRTRRAWASELAQAFSSSSAPKSKLVGGAMFDRGGARGGVARSRRVPERV